MLPPPLAHCRSEPQHDVYPSMENSADRPAAGSAVNIEIDCKPLGETGFDAPAELAPGIGAVGGFHWGDTRHRGSETRVHVEGACDRAGLTLNRTYVSGSGFALGQGSTNA